MLYRYVTGWYAMYGYVTGWLLVPLRDLSVYVTVIWLRNRWVTYLYNIIICYSYMMAVSGLGGIHEWLIWVADLCRLRRAKPSWVYT